MGFPPAMILWTATFVLGAALAYLTYVDLRSFLLPDAVTLPLIGAGLLLALWLEPEIDVRLIGAGAGFACLYLVDRAYHAVRGRRGVGLGDAKLLAAAGAWLGWPALPVVLLIASGAGLVAVAVAGLRGHRISASARLPFGPFLAIGFAAVWIYRWLPSL